MMGITYKLVGYDRQSETLAVEHILPVGSVGHAKAIAGIAERPDIIGDWPLSAAQAARIAESIGQAVDLGGYDWFLEPYYSAEANQPT
jgi:hypothetical protein